VSRHEGRQRGVSARKRPIQHPHLVAAGAPTIAFTPMAAEAIMIALLALGWRMFDAEPRQ
jgi:hypothetical protein